jgi:broad specificity phosphatase PhoE
MPRIHLIRHGRPASTWGQGEDDDPGLDPVGQAQAEAVRDRLLALPPGERPTRVVSSPLRRCRETAAPTAAALGLEIEIDPGVGEIPTPDALAADQRRPWLQRAFQGTWDQIEGDRDYAVWREAVVAALQRRAGAAVFSHFVAINAVVSRLLDDPRVVGFRPDHASVTTLGIDEGGLTLLARGDEAVTTVL